MLMQRQSLTRRCVEFLSALAILFVLIFILSFTSKDTIDGPYDKGNLTNLKTIFPEKNLSLLGDVSGVEYVPTTNTLFVVHNHAVNTDATIDELTTDGVLIRAITCITCGDIEGITLVSSNASTTAPGIYDHVFMLSTENNTMDAEIYRVIIASVGPVTVNKNDYFATGISHASNQGLEGIAYNPTSGVMYIAREKIPTLFEVTLDATHSTKVSTICSNLDFTSIAKDFSDLEYAHGILYVLSHENNRLIPVDITSTSTCVFVDSDRDGSLSTALDTDDYLNVIGVALPRQPEGVTWDSVQDHLYIVSEPDYLRKYRVEHVQ